VEGNTVKVHKRTARFDANKFELIHQVGGIRTARFDWPDMGGAGGCRVALVDTGSGLRFTVALDRGGDIVEAFYQNASLAYLTPNGYKPPMQPLYQDDDWLAAWPGGLVTSCGPQYIGPGREEDGNKLVLHGHHSNTPAALVGLKNPNPRGSDLDMHLEMIIRDTKMYGPSVEVRRRIVCQLGRPVIELHDEVVNLGNATVAHNWLYHINFGYPLLNRDSQVVYSGTVNGGWVMNADMSMSDPPKEERDLGGYLTVPDPLTEHTAAGSRGLIVDINCDSQGIAHCGLANHNLPLGVEVSYPAESLPRLANWQHYGPNGSYVCALEPFSGSLWGKPQDKHPLAAQWLAPGQTKSYDLTITVHADTQGIEHLLNHQGDLKTDF
jgi:hypothetical protein